jgi:hypothetical protein
VLLPLPRPCRALQTSARLRLDNDFFNVWQPLSRRPDEEYTQGTQVALRWSGTGLVLQRVMRGLSACRNQPLGEVVCGRLSLSLGQDMYTPAIDSPQLLPGQRPYAGWLYLEGAERAESNRRLDLVRVTIGVTGPPSLAETIQEFWHNWFGYRKPLGWDGQLPFEADVGVSYEGARALGRPGSPDSHLIIAPTWVLNAGTVLSDLELGVRATAGLRPPVPWGTTLRHPPSGPGFYLVAALRGDVVARNLFLDGTTFRASPQVVRKWLVGQLEVGVGASIGRARLEWTAIHRGREYATQPRPHTYSRLSLGWE